MLLNRLKVLGEVVVLVGLLVLGTGLRPRPLLAEKPAPPAATSAKTGPKVKGPAKGQAENLRLMGALKWRLLRVEVEGRTLHVADVPAERSWGRDSAEEFLASAGAQLSLRGLPVAKDAKVALDGEEVPLKNLHAGVNLSLTFAEDRPVVTAIEATTPPRAGYVVKEVIVSNNTIMVTRRQDDKPLVLPVAWDALITGVPALKDLKAGAHVSLHLEVEGGKMTVKQLRVR